MGMILSVSYPITVSIKKNLISLDHGTYSSGYWVRDDVYEWLVGNVGPGAQSGGWSDGCEWLWYYSYRSGPQDNAILFRDHKLAMLFKLTWA